MEKEFLPLEEVLEWLVDIPEEDHPLVKRLIKAAESYLMNATGKNFSPENELAKQFCLFLIADWYENREYTGKKVGEQVKFIVQSMLTQLQYSSEEGTENEV